MGIKGDSDEKRRASVDIGISLCCKCNVITAALRCGIKTVTRVLADGLRDGFPGPRRRTGFSVPTDAINRGNERLLRYLQVRA